MTADEFIRDYRAVRPRDWRVGQTAFNNLLEVRPDLAEAVRATGLDPFYFDERLPTFEAFIRDQWATAPPTGAKGQP